MNKLWEFLKPIFSIAICALCCMSLLFIIIATAIYIDTSRLDEIRYCPSCGIDLVEGR